MEQRTFSVDDIVNCMNEEWERNRLLHKEGQITLNEKAGRDSAIVALAKRFGLINAFVRGRR